MTARERGALNVTEAAAYLGISRQTFYDQVLAQLRVVQLGSRKLIPVVELDRWLDEHAAYPIERAR